MQIHIDTATDDLPAVIRMLQALNAGQDTRLDEIKDAVEKHAATLRQGIVKSGPDHKMQYRFANPHPATYEDKVAAWGAPGAAAAEERQGHAIVKPDPDHKMVVAGVPADKLYSGDALKAATEPDAHCDTLPNGDCVSEDPRCMHQPTPEQVFAAPIPSLFDSAQEALAPYGVKVTPGPIDAPKFSDVTVDAAGLPWDSRIHSGAKSKLANGNWKLLRNVDPALVASVEAELRGAPKPAAPTTSAAVQVAEPAIVPPPPAPVAPPVTALSPPAPTPIPPAPKPITNAAELVAAIMDKRFTTDQVNAACQAVGVESVPKLLVKQDMLPAVLKELGL